MNHDDSSDQADPASNLTEEMEGTLEQIADQLSILSQQEDTPFGVNGSIDPFDTDEVDFNSSAWLLRVLEVQGWLNLSEELLRGSAEEDPTDTALTLFRSLEVKDPQACVSDAPGYPVLTDAGAAALGNRLDLAIMMMDRFVEECESISVKAATVKWSEWWDEESSAPASREPIRADTDMWSINEFCGWANDEKLNLSPSYQRGDVWSKRLSQQLIISILRGIPLPSVILLKPQSQGAQAEYEVVDGKQRLTAILRFIGKHPDALRLVEEAQADHEEVPFKEAFETDYRKFRRLWKTHRNEALNATLEAKYYFPFKLPNTDELPDEKLKGKYYSEVHDVPIRIGSSQETVKHVFEHVSKYKIPVIEYIDTAPRQIHEVFHLYNKQGKHLNAEEIRNALFHHLDLMRMLLVAAGDNTDIRLLAPYIPEEEYRRVREIGEMLTEYRFGIARYRRTKLLSWLVALILEPSLQEDGALNVRSTAKQINELLTSVESEATHKLREHEVLIQLLMDLHACIEAHASAGSWAPRFKDDNDGSKWQELQLVASLVAMFIGTVAREDVDNFLEERHEAVYEYTSQHLRPEKTQNKTQWGFIGEVSLGLLNVLGIDLGTAEDALEARYGVSCIPTLEAASRHYKDRRPE